MQKQAFYKQAHVWSGKVLTTLHRRQKSVSLLGWAEARTTTQQIHSRVFSPYHGGMVDFDFLISGKSWHFQTPS